MDIFAAQLGFAPSQTLLLQHGLELLPGQGGALGGGLEDLVAHVHTKVADKMAHEAHEAAEKADNLKNKVHNFADPKK